MKKSKKISIISSSRADYGILKNLIVKLSNDKKFNLDFIVTGSHLDKKYGKTISFIKKDKVIINHKIRINLGKTSKLNISHIISEYIKKISKYLDKSRPDGIIILGDRYEMLAIATVANIFNIPIFHLHGGEVTSGSYDDQIRHSITKLSFLHFASTLRAKNRIIQMGEDKKRVFFVGSLGVENLLKYKKKNNLTKIFDFKLKNKKILISYHSQTKNIKLSRLDFLNILKALKYFKNCSLIFTKPNHDFDSDFILKNIKKFLKTNKNAILISSLGQENFYECLKNFDCIVGNSSAGIIEAPSAKIPSVNIGNRQEGRDMAKSVYTIKGNQIIIRKILNKILSSKKIRNFKNPYFKNTKPSDLIISILKKYDFSKSVIKKFNDI